jgi:ATP-binding cassette, subfamily C, bacterial CydD
VRALDPRLVRRATPVRTLLGVDAGLGVATAILVLVQATLLARIVARAFDGASLGDVAPEVLLLALAFAARGALVWGFEVAGARAASAVLSEFRLELVERRVRTQPAALDGVDAGEIAAAGVQGVDGLRAYFGRYLPQIVLACLVPLAVLGWVAAIDLTSALIMLMTLPLVPVFMWLIGRYTEERTRERWLALRLLSTHFLDVVRGLPTLRLFNQSRAQGAAIAGVSDRHRRATMGTLRVSFLSGTVLELAATLGVALVAVTVGVRLVGGGLGLQAGLTVLVLAPELYLPLRQLGAEFHASADGVAVAERIIALSETPPEVQTHARIPAPSPAAEIIRFEGVSFAYPARAGLVLDELELELFPRETLLLAGESGAGKSTVASLLLRLAEPTAGHLTVGKVDLAECDTDDWRGRLAWVPQRPTIFHGTVAENIRLARAEAADEDVRAAAVAAGADAFIQGLPAAYETVVGDGGRPLSAGERRRLALARAFVRDAPFVILDEPTADLDPESAQLVGRAIGSLQKGRTILLIAHRPELAWHADRVVVLEAGRPLSFGNGGRHDD